MPYLIKTKTPPSTGAMACCRSIIGAGQCEHMIVQSSRVVATLDEARRSAEEITVRVPGYATAIGFPTEAWVIEAITEQGGTVGPLPDGTVIEVEPCDRFWLSTQAGLSEDNALTVAEIIAAYNERS